MSDQPSNDEFDIVDDTPAEDEGIDPREEELQRQQAERDHLDRRHIKSIVLEKQALYRAARYKTIFALVLLGTALQLAWLAIGRIQAHLLPRAAAYLVVAIGFVVFGINLLKKAKLDRAAAATTAIPEPEEQPDFSQLSDGSQIVENLKNMHGRGSL